MDAQSNKDLMTRIFAELEKGNGAPFVAAFAQDAEWTLTGTTPWSGLYKGKEAIQDNLLHPLFAQFGDRYKNRAIRIIAEGDIVVVECRGKVTTKAGARYDNEYCYVCRMAQGEIRELTEYMDTALVERVLEPPAAVA